MKEFLTVSSYAAVFVTLIAYALGDFLKKKTKNTLCNPLLISSVRKIEFTATAAELRGFYLRTPQSCSKEYKYHFRDYVFLLIGFAVLGSAIALRFVNFK